ncbi:MAG: potassium channel family protein, partial [bacterium]|nr:potassium channel family protein [bacterium]
QIPMSKAAMGSIGELKSRILRYRFGILLAALIVLLVAEPLLALAMPSSAPILWNVLQSAIFLWLTLSAVNAVRGKKASRNLAALLGGTWLAVRTIDLTIQSQAIQVVVHGLAAVFFATVIFILLAYIFGQEKITVDTIFASLCVYLLMGIVWAVFYSLIELLQPEAFTHSSVAMYKMRFGGQGSHFSIYYSFVTLTTLGYGDIVPLSPAAKALAAMEAVAGQLYLTVVVAWLVGLRIAHANAN